MKRTPAEKPKRVRKVAQFDLMVWLPDGARLQIKSIKNLAPEVWKADAIKHLSTMLTMVQEWPYPPRA